MSKSYFSTVCFLFIYLSICAGLPQSATTTVELQFYSEKLELTYNPDIILKDKLVLEETAIKAFYQQLEDTNYQALLNSLEDYRTRLQLNDWLYYELMYTAVRQIFGQKNKVQQTLSCWFFLSKSGYDTRLTYYKGRAFVYAYSEDAIFETPMIEDDGRKFINLSSIHEKMKEVGVALDMLSYVANAGGKTFSFELQQLPILPARPQDRTLTFNYREKEYSLQVKADQTLCEVMKNYPIFEEQKYFEVPLSPTLKASLLPQLEKVIAGQPMQTALEILASFTRSAFTYKEDQEFFGFSKPMIADEVFHYSFSDCEDRSALFYALVRELLDLPMIIIAYPDHLTIAVAPEKPIVGSPIAYKGRNYYICDPTGPKYSNDIGYAPKGYEQQSFEILGKYK